MNVSELLTDALDRVHEQVPGIIGGLSDDDLAWRPDPGANSIAWLVWHVTRVEDDHVADVAGTDQAWVDDGWAERFGLSLDVSDFGYGHTPEQVGRVRVSADLLAGYAAAVARRTHDYVAALGGEDGAGGGELDRVVDTRWEPPVTLGARLVSVVNEVNQHVGQAAYLRGLLAHR